jgi:hypothetical protein
MKVPRKETSAQYINVSAQHRSAPQKQSVLNVSLARLLSQLWGGMRESLHYARRDASKRRRTYS